MRAKRGGLRPLCRRPIVFVLVLMLVGAGDAHGRATAAPIRPPVGSSAPLQGVYEECGPAVSGAAQCAERLRQIRAAGFRVVVNYTQWYASARQVLDYADQAAALGMKVIWPLNAKAWRDGTSLPGYYRYLSPDCHCADNAGFKRWVINLVKHHPATWGYYVGDEVSAGEYGQVEALSREIARLDSVHPRLYVAWETARSQGANLRPFADVADVVGADFYPIGRGEPLASLRDVAHHVQTMAYAQHRESALVLQAFDWSQYSGGMQSRWPSCSEMRRMRDLALSESRPRLLLWYSYYDIARSADPAAHLADLRAAAFGRCPG